MPFRIGVVVALPVVPDVHPLPGVPGVVASRFPGAVKLPPFGSKVVNTRPGGITPVTFHEPTFIALVIVNPIGVIAVPTVAGNVGSGPEGFAVSVEARSVAPAIESTVPRAAAAIPADLRIEPTGEAATYSPADAAMRRTGVR